MKQPDLGLKIIELRQNQGLTQEEVVKQCNISVRTLQRIESGEVEPRGYTLRLLSKVLDFDLFSLSQNISDHNSQVSEYLQTDIMENVDKTKDILIKRYAYLKSSSVNKIKSKLENNSIDDIIEKHNNMITFSIILVVVVGIAFVIQLVTLYPSKNITLSLITNVGVLVVFQRGIHFNYEIKNILKALKELG